MVEFTCIDITVRITLREKCPNTEFFLVRIQPKYGKVRTRKNSLFGHFLLSVNHTSRENFENFGLTSQPRNIFGLQSCCQLN